MVGLERVGLRKPEDGQLGQHLAAIGDAVGEDVVEGRDAVGGDHQQLVSSELIGVADLAAREKLERQLGAGHRRSGDHLVVTPRPKRWYARSGCSRPAHGSKTSSIRPPIRFITSSSFSSSVLNPSPAFSIDRIAAFWTTR